MNEEELLKTVGFNSWFNRYRNIEEQYKHFEKVYMEANSILTAEVGRRLAVTINPFRDRNISLGEVWVNDRRDGVCYELIYSDAYETYCTGEGVLSISELQTPIEILEAEHKNKLKEKIKTIEENIEYLRKTDYNAYEMLMERIRR